MFYASLGKIFKMLNFVFLILKIIPIFKFLLGLWSNLNAVQCAARIVKKSKKNVLLELEPAPISVTPAPPKQDPDSDPNPQPSE